MLIRYTANNSRKKRAKIIFLMKIYKLKLEKKNPNFPYDR